MCVVCVCVEGRKEGGRGGRCWAGKSSEMGLTLSRVDSQLSQFDIEELQEACHRRFSQTQIESLYERFRDLDRSGRGFITAKELLKIPEFTINPLQKRLVTIFHQVNFREFIILLSAFSPMASAEDRLRVVFQVYDVDRDDAVTKADVISIQKILCGNHIKDTELAEIVERAFGEASLRSCGIDPDAMTRGLTFEEFKRVFEVYGDPEVSDLKIDFDTLLAERQPYQR